MGMLLEIFTITPVGVWVFHGIRDRVNKLHKAGDK
jgi:hypothetical protein